MAFTYEIQGMGVRTPVLIVVIVRKVAIPANSKSACEMENLTCSYLHVVSSLVSLYINEYCRNSTLADECVNQHIYLHPGFDDHCRDLERVTGTNSILISDHCVTYNQNKIDNNIR